MAVINTLAKLKVYEKLAHRTMLEEEQMRKGLFENQENVQKTIDIFMDIYNKSEDRDNKALLLNKRDDLQKYLDDTDEVMDEIQTLREQLLKRLKRKREFLTNQQNSQLGEELE